MRDSIERTRPKVNGNHIQRPLDAGAPDDLTLTGELNDAAWVICRYVTTLALFLLTGVLCSCNNDPYRAGEAAQPTYFSTFSTAPSKMDPTSAYYSHEGAIIDQIYEPPFTYHYLKRPYTLIPLTATEIPTPVYTANDGSVIAPDAITTDNVARVSYTIRLRDDIRYQPHPCFARQPNGQSFYAHITEHEARAYRYPSRFPHQASRSLRAADYALQVRRLADPRLASPVYSTLAAYIVGMDQLQDDYTRMIDQERARRREATGAGYNQEADERARPLTIDYFAAPFEGIRVDDQFTFTITLKRPYPQILYWMCMHFFAPVPHEALDFYAIPGIAAAEFNLNRCPVGTGPYTLNTFRPNELIELTANPNYHHDVYPSEGEPGDAEAGLLQDAGKPLPFVQRQVYRLEREAIPAWTKFLQGYMDGSGIASDVFDKAIVMEGGEDAALSEAMAAKGMRLVTAVRTMFYYTCFNMEDEVVGGYSEAQRKLRQAISIALDYNEFLDIFANGRGVLAQGPIPPGIPGYVAGEAGTNPYVDQWDATRGRHVRQPIENARRLLVEAGYPGGRRDDGRPLTLHYDHAQGVDPTFRSWFQWMRDRLALLGIQFIERGTDLSRFREKRRNGNWQVSSGGWLADYPDPENFLFLFYGPNSKVTSGGPNMCNYANPRFDELFQRMESMVNSPERMAIIASMLDVLRADAPAAWQYFPVSYALLHEWYRNYKPHEMSYNTVKYRRIDAALRVRRQREWNRPRWQPVAIVLGLALLALIPGAIRIYRREHHA